MSPRALPEWIGATPDSPVPPRVKARVFEKYGGRCYVSGLKLGPGAPWQIDHIQALANGGENRELNLAPIAVAKHREKTAEDVALKAKTSRQRAKFLGIWPRGQKIKSRGFRKRAAPDLGGTI